MNKTLIMLALVAISGCSTTTQRTQEVEAVNDYVVANELKEVNEIRLNKQLSYTYLNDRYVTIPTRRGDYLVELSRTCYELQRNVFTPEMVDHRDNMNILRARFDTIRGCKIGTIYEVTEGQRKELSALGDAPGDEIYLPDED